MWARSLGGAQPARHVSSSSLGCEQGSGIQRFGDGTEFWIEEAGDGRIFSGDAASADEPSLTERVKRTFKQRCAEPAVAILHQDRRARREMISCSGVEGENGSTDDSL